MYARFAARGLLSIVVLTGTLGSCRSSTPVIAGGDANVSVPATSAGPSVWSADLVTVRPGDHDRYRRFIEANWARARHTAQERGQIRSYHALFTADTAAGSWHVLLLTEYHDSAAYERREEIFQPILTAQGRTLIDGKATRELTSRVANHWAVRLFGAP